MTLAVAEPVFRSQWERRLGRTDSVIEALFLEALCEQAVEMGYCISSRQRSNNETIVVKPQKWFDRVRADFFISFHFFGKDIEIIVECDGHDFHERTKDQAARDRKRDRYFQRLGVKVLRFTGKELRHHADKCAAEVLDEIMRFQTRSIVEACPAPINLSD